jgi:aquaporin Z
MSERPDRQVPWQPLLAELIGTALLLLIGLSLVIFMWGSGSPMARLLPNEGLRRLITGFLFGCTGASIALSPVGRESGAHINPAVTFAFWMFRKIDAATAAGYVVAQLVGACLGCLPLLAWGEMGRSVAFGATLPAAGCSTAAVVAGEAVTTVGLIVGLCVFLGFRRLRPFTPALMPPLYAFMVWAESPISGTSTNPARSFGPAVISGQWHGWWIYWVGPVLGTLASLLVANTLARRIEVAKLYHFDSDRRGLFRRAARSGPAAP